MKKPFSLILILLFIIHSQAKCDLMKVKNDDVTGKTSISSEQLSFENLSMEILAGTRRGSYPKVIFKLKEGCVDPYQDIFVLFQNGKRIKIANYVFEYNCEGYSGFLINNSANEKLLKTENIKTIRIDTRTTFQQIELNSEEAEKIKNVIQCAFDRKSWEENIEYKGTW